MVGAVYLRADEGDFLQITSKAEKTRLVRFCVGRVQVACGQRLAAVATRRAAVEVRVAAVLLVTYIVVKNQVV